MTEQELPEDYLFLGNKTTYNAVSKPFDCSDLQNCYCRRRYKAVFLPEKPCIDTADGEPRILGDTEYEKIRAMYIPGDMMDRWNADREADFSRIRTNMKTHHHCRPEEPV